MTIAQRVLYCLADFFCGQCIDDMPTHWEETPERKAQLDVFEKIILLGIIATAISFFSAITVYYIG